MVVGGPLAALTAEGPEMVRNYIGVVHKDEDSSYGVSFPDFPGTMSANDTLSGLAEDATEALGLTIRCMLDDGEDVPAPRSLDSIMADPGWNDGSAYIVVGVEVPERAVRVNISVHEGLLSRIDAAARVRGMSRSAFLAESARRMMGEQKA
jgi:predicted RNase H-like HicB family nuclease